MPPKLVPVLLKRVQEVRIIAMEDVYFTGRTTPDLLNLITAVRTIDEAE